VSITLTPKRKLLPSQTTENYVDHIAQINQAQMKTDTGIFTRRLKIPVGTDKFG